MLASYGIEVEFVIAAAVLKGRWPSPRVGGVAVSRLSRRVAQTVQWLVVRPKEMSNKRHYQAKETPKDRGHEAFLIQPVYGPVWMAITDELHASRTCPPNAVWRREGTLDAPLSTPLPLSPLHLLSRLSSLSKQPSSGYRTFVSHLSFADHYRQAVQ